MPKKNLLAIAATVFAASLLTACDSGVTAHQPGVYKGAKDPLATAEAAAEREGSLRDRAAAAFTDRP